MDSLNPGAEVGSGINSTGSTSGLTSMGAFSAVSDVAGKFIGMQRSKNMANYNIAMAGLQARMNRLAANKRIADIRKKAQEVYGSQRASYAKAGIDLSSRSALQVMLDSQKEAELDIIYEEINADYGQSVFNTQQGLYDMEKRNLKYDFALDTGKTILQVARKKYERG